MTPFLGTVIGPWPQIHTPFSLTAKTKHRISEAITQRQLLFITWQSQVGRLIPDTWNISAYFSKIKWCWDNIFLLFFYMMSHSKLSVGWLCYIAGSINVCHCSSFHLLHQVSYIFSDILPVKTMQLLFISTSGCNSDNWNLVVMATFSWTYWLLWCSVSCPWQVRVSMMKWYNDPF